MFLVEVDEFNIKINDLVYPIQRFFDGEILLFDNDFVIDDVTYHLYLKYDLKKMFFECEMRVVDADDDAVGYLVDIDSFVKSFSLFDYFRNYLTVNDLNVIKGYVDSIKDYVSSVRGDISSAKGDVIEEISEVRGMISSVRGDINSAKGIVIGEISEVQGMIGSVRGDINSAKGIVIEEISEVQGMIGSVKSDISSARSDVIEEIGEILNFVRDDIKKLGNKIDVVELFSLPQKIQESINKMLSLKSLNGSNGSKFKDGEKLQVQGYDGDWEVISSFPMLNSDSNLIILYYVKQDDKFMIVPAPLIKV